MMTSFLPSITNARCAHVSDGGRCQRGDANIRTLSADDNAERYAVTVKQLVVICCLVEQNLNQERCFFSPLCIHNGKTEESTGSYLPPCWRSSISISVHVSVPVDSTCRSMVEKQAIWHNKQQVFLRLSFFLAFLCVEKPMTLRLDEKMRQMIAASNKPNCSIPRHDRQ